MHTPICQSCGALLHQQGAVCQNCGALVSPASTSHLSPINFAPRLQSTVAVVDPASVSKVLLAAKVAEPEPAQHQDDFFSSNMAAKLRMAEFVVSEEKSACPASDPAIWRNKATERPKGTAPKGTASLPEQAFINRAAICALVAIGMLTVLAVTWSVNLHQQPPSREIAQTAPSTNARRPLQNWRTWNANPSPHKAPLNRTEAVSSTTDQPSVVTTLKYIFAFPESGTPAQFTQFFIRLLLAFLAAVLGLVAFSFKMFGASGWLNIKSKKNYIPSQYKQEWSQTVRTFGKGLKPGGLPLGNRTDWSPLQVFMPKRVDIPPAVRQSNPHTLIIGGTGKGKSRLMASMATHDIESQDRAVIIIDSDGALSTLIKKWIHEHKDSEKLSKRLVTIYPTSKKGSVGYNPLQFPPDGDLQAAAQAIVSGFKAIYVEPPGAQTQWNQQTANILRNSAVLLMANQKTLADLPKLLSDNDFRDVLLDNVTKMKDHEVEYETLIEAWSQYKRLARSDQWISWVEPILNRIQPMLSDPTIRPLITQTEGSLNLGDVIAERKILLVRVPKGRLEQNANLFGSLIVSGLRQAAQSLAESDSGPQPSALYLDAFPHFIEKDTYENITSETRTLRIELIGTGRTLQELPEDFRTKILINTGSVCCFSVTKKDADILGPSMFRVDGRKVKSWTLGTLANPVNTSPLYEQVIDEEKLNIDRLAGQDDRTFFYYKVGGTITVFQVRTPDFSD